MNKFIIYVILLSSIQFYSQKKDAKPYTFGKVTSEELNMKVYEKDSTANAVVLYNYGDTQFVFEYGKTFLRTIYYTKIKIFNKEGLDHATVSIRLYYVKGQTSELVKDIKAITHNVNETSSYLSKDHIYKNILNDKLKEVTFTLPNIKDGSVIEYEYVLESKYYYNFTGWEFQKDIPTIYSEFHALIPGNWNYNRRLIGPKKLDKQENKIRKKCFYINIGEPANCEELNYVMKDIPAFIEEKYMTNKNNYLSKIKFELATLTDYQGIEKKYTSTWKVTDKNLKIKSNIGKQLKNTNFFKKNIPVELLNETDPLIKCKLIYTYIQQNITWNEKYNSLENDVKKAFKDKIGNIYEINLALINALNAADIDAKIMLSATRDVGLPTKVQPVLYDYNYLLAFVTINEKVYLLDATEKLLPFNTVQFEALNEYGRVLDFKSGSYWYDIIPKTNSFSNTTLEINISEDEIIGKQKTVYNGYLALSKRKKMKNSSSNDYILEIENNSKNISINNYKNTNLDSLEEKLIEEYEYDEFDSVGERIYFNPFLNKLDKNPFQLKERTYPVNYGYKQKYVNSIKITIPDNYNIKSIPETVTIKLPYNGGSFICKSISSNNTITIYSKLSLNKASYQPQEYPYLKELYNQMIKTQNSLITLEKI